MLVLAIGGALIFASVNVKKKGLNEEPNKEKIIIQESNGIKELLSKRVL